MTRNASNRTAGHQSALDEIDLSEMDTVSGGCQKCQSATAQGADNNKMAALAPPMYQRRR